MIEFIKKTKELGGTYYWLDNKYAIVFRKKVFYLVKEQYGQYENIEKDYSIQNLYDKYLVIGK